MKKPIFIVFVVFTVIFSCSDKDRVADEIAQIDIDLEVVRFDREFAEAKPEDIPALKKDYPYLFPEQYPDSIWEAKLTDTIQVELMAEVGAAFSNFTDEETALQLLFKHIKYYFPKFDAPKVITVTSDVQYNNRVIWADTLLLIGIDNYLGQEHRFYSGIEKYIAAGLDKQFLASDVASAFAKKVVKYPSDRAFLAQMIYYGKELYLKDKLLPFQTDEQKIRYSKEQLDWAKANEDPIWRYFVERELLYSTDAMLAPRFLDPAPFSKFRLELDNESPGRIGRYMGWQIVRAFMEKNEVSLQQLLQLPAEEIFKKSNYKPKK